MTENAKINASEVSAVIERLYTLMDRYGDPLLSKSESSTRYVLIDPILRALGWNTENPRCVRVEDTLDQGGIPDYTLLKNGKPIAYVEAKKWGTISRLKKLEDLSIDHIFRQLKGYCNSKEVHLAILTDGGAWYIFDFSNRKVARDVVKIDFGEDETKEAAKKLLQIARNRISKFQN